MKKFRFTLQTVHTVRELRRDEAERVLARASDAVRDANDSLEEVRRARDRAAENFAVNIHTGEINPFHAALSADYLAALTRRELEAQTRLAETKRECEAQRVSAAEAARAAEATARLRARQRERHERQAARVEQEMLDEFATLNAARLQDGGRP